MYVFCTPAPKKIEMWNHTEILMKFYLIEGYNAFDKQISLWIGTTGQEIWD
jgi:hypothetical protein